MSSSDATWAPIPMGGDTHATRRIGPLQVWVSRWQDECRIAFQRDEVDAFEGKPSPACKPDDIDWNRWVGHVDESTVCTLTPVLPPRPVIVKPAMPLQVLPGERLDLFVSVPVWVRISLKAESSRKTVDLLEEPTVVLSNSWFGSPVDGELCYALKTSARRRLEDLRQDLYRAVCPLTIRNETGEAFGFDRLCIRVQYLGLYAGDSHLWTNHGTLLYRGDARVDGVKFDPGSPALDQASRLLSGPRETPRRGGVQRAFDSIRTLCAFGEIS